MIILRKKKICSVYDYCNENGIAMEVYDDSIKRFVRLPCVDIDSFEKGRNESEYRVTYPIYSTILENVDLFGNSDAFVKDKYYLTDKYGWDKEGMPSFLPWFTEKMDIERKCVKLKGLKGYKEIEKGINLIKMWPGNYYHFTMESLARLNQIEESEAYADYPLLIDEIALKDPKNAELVSIVDNHGRSIIPIERNTKYRIGEMVYVAFCSWGSQHQNYLKKGMGTAVDKNATEFIRNRVLSHFGFKKNKIQKVYIARGNNDRLTNESELMCTLCRKGYTIINPDKVSLEEEIYYFATADVIVGVAGAGFTNIIYSDPNVKAYQICPMELQYVSSLYCEMAANVGVSLLNISAQIVKYGVNMNKSKFTVDIDRLLKMIGE